MTQITQNELKQAEKLAAAGDRLGVLAKLAELEAVSPRPKLAMQWSFAVMMAFETGDESMSLRFARILAEEVPTDPRIWQLLGQAAIQVSRGDEAIAAFEKSLQIQPNNPPVLLELGRALAMSGKLEQGRSYLRQVIALEPTNHVALEHLAMINDFHKNPELIEQLQAAQSRSYLATPEIRAALHHGLSVAFAKTGNVEKSWENTKASAKAVASLTPDYSIDRYEWEVERQIHLFGKDIYAKPKNPNAGEQAIFILGVPRSGTTLIERMLAAHDQVTAGGENRLFWLAAQTLARKDNEQVKDYIQHGDLGPMGEKYMSLMCERLGDFQRFTDKSLRNELRLGIIHAVLPAAKVIWVQRDALDTAWSCYRTHFAEGNQWSNDPANIARFIAGYERLMGHWKTIFGKNMLQLNFEDFVQNPGKGAQKLQKFLDLPDQDLSGFHQAQATVSTASFAQVREPVNEKGIGKWQPFDAYMQPFRDALIKAELL